MLFVVFGLHNFIYSPCLLLFECAKDCLCLFSIRSDDVSVVGITNEYSTLILWLGKSLDARVKQNIAINVIAHDNLKRKKHKPSLFIDLLWYNIELLVCKCDWYLNAINFVLFTGPIVMQPAPVILLFGASSLIHDHLLKFFRRFLAWLNEVSNQCHKTWAQATLG